MLSLECEFGQEIGVVLDIILVEGDNLLAIGCL